MISTRESSGNVRTAFAAVLLFLSLSGCEAGAVPHPDAPAGDVTTEPAGPAAAELARVTDELADVTRKIRRLESTPRIIVDTGVNASGCELRFRSNGEDLLVAPCSAGSGKSLADSETGAKWTFNTPRGEFRILSRLANPIWRKPDWAFVEDGQRPPSANASARFESGVLGDYALGFGDGYFIHGTLYTRLIGDNVTHGCVRLEDAPLEELFQRAPLGTPLLIF